MSSHQELWQELDDDAYRVLTEARQEYASDHDIFAGFCKIAEVCELTPRQVIVVLMTKHLLAIEKGVSLRESMRGRYIDVMNYLRLLYAWDSAMMD
jgi:hypothetical protein